MQVLLRHQCTRDLIGRDKKRFALLLPEPGDPGKDLGKPGHPEPGFRREISAGIERLLIRSHDDGERPAALPGHHLADAHVHAVDIRPLLPVNLDTDKIPVQDRRNTGILEGFVRHDMAPVAGGIANREKDRLVFPRGPGECLLSPRVPVDRVMRVLEKVRALLADARFTGRLRDRNTGSEDPEQFTGGIQGSLLLREYHLISRA